MPTHIAGYFTTTPATAWDIRSFLEAEYVHAGKEYDHNRSVGAWISSLRHLEYDTDATVSSRANELLAKYFTERPSDRMAARNWHDSKKRKRAKAEKEEREKSEGSGRRDKRLRPLTKNIYHGPVNQGNLYNSSLTLSQIQGPVPVAALPDTATKSNASRTTTPVFANAKPDDPVPEPPIDPRLTDPEVVPQPEERPEERPEEKSEEQPKDQPSAGDPDAEAEVDTIEAERLGEVCAYLQQVYIRMTDKLPLESGGYLEDSLYTYAVESRTLTPAHFCVADASVLTSIIPSQTERSTVLARVPRLPAFPAGLEAHLSRYRSVKTPRECRYIARSSPDDSRDVHWLDDVVRHVVELITDTNHILLLETLNEGVWDCLVYAPFWDKYFSAVPDLVLQRKEITLLASASEPYSYLPYDARYDGVVCTRTSRRDRANRFELCLFETSSRFEGVESRKWVKDRTKLLAGCRAMLYRLQECVERDEEVVRKLQVVGVLQAGRWNQIFVMSCLGRNVFFLREGGVREFPTALDQLDRAWDIVSSVWKARRVVVDTAAALRAFLDQREKEKTVRTDEDFL